MQSSVSHSTAVELDSAVNDLGPLAWVLDELRKSLESASKALKRFVRDAEAAKGSDLAAIDASQLRIARQQLHQAVGALEMVGMAGPSLLLRSMETAVQRFIQHPEQCSSIAATNIEKAGFALAEYLEGVLADKPVSSISLFPQYRDVQEIVRAERIHPADLWSINWRWIDPSINITLAPRPADEDTKKLFDLTVLQLMKGNVNHSAEILRDLSFKLSLDQTDYQIRIFWKISAAYFEAVANKLLITDIYVRRAASRILLQYSSLLKGDNNISERLALDLLFFCAQAVPDKSSFTPILTAVRATYSLNNEKAVNYEMVQFGRFDPALLTQARKRIAAAKETWSSLCAGDNSKFKSVLDQFSLVADSLVKLHPESEPLAVSLTRAVDSVIRTAQTPRLELAMEFATSILFLEAVFEDLDPNDPQLAVRTMNLAERLESVREGGKPQPLEIWMEDLYRRVSDKQTMGSVVGELHQCLNELEKLLDIFFRKPEDKSPLQPVARQLSQMRGVLSVLGLDQASNAVLRMKTSVESMLLPEFNTDVAKTKGLFNQLGNNLGALAFLIDMLNYQPALAKKLFVFDDESGELKSIMGQAKTKKEKEDSLSNSALLIHDPSHASLPKIETSNIVLAVDSDTLLIKSDIPTDQDNTVENIKIVYSDPITPEADISIVNTEHLPLKDIDQNAPLINTSSEIAESLVEKQLFESVTPPEHIPFLPDLNTTSETSEEDDELLQIFLEEAKEVSGNGLEALSCLTINPADGGAMTILRRAFHTLKGSSRMVGLDEFGHAAWSLEQLINTWLADQKNATPNLCLLCTKSIHGFEAWIMDIANRQDKEWTSEPFTRFADNLRLHNIFDPSMDLTNPSKAILPISEIIISTTTPEIFEQIKSTEDVEFQLLTTTDESLVLVPDNEIGIKQNSLIDSSIDNINRITDSTDSATPEKAEIELSIDSQTYLLNASEDLLQIDLLIPHETNDSIQLNQLPLADGDDVVIDDFAREIENAEDTAFSETAISQLFEFDKTDENAFLNKQPILELPAEETIDPYTNDNTISDLVSFTEDLPIELQNVLVEDFQSENYSGSSQDSENEQIRVIGNLRISIPLYNVYLNEADEWSRRLVTEMTEWSLDYDQPVNDSSIFLAHSLAGSSATVGFLALSEVARTLEHALEQSKIYHGTQASLYANDFVNAAEDIRRLLHQFAAGFLREPDIGLIARIKNINFLELSAAKSEILIASSDNLSSQHLPVEFVKETYLNTPDSFVDSDASLELMMDNNELTDSITSLDLGFSSFDSTKDLSTDNALSLPDIASLDIVSVKAIEENIPDFYLQGSELMQRLGSVLRQWLARPDNTSALEEVLRILLVIQTSAGQAGASTVAYKARGIEAQIRSFDVDDTLSAVDIEPLLGRFNGMQGIYDVQRQIHETALLNKTSFSDDKKIQSNDEILISADTPLDIFSSEPADAVLHEPADAVLHEPADAVLHEPADVVLHEPADVVLHESDPVIEISIPVQLSSSEDPYLESPSLLSEVLDGQPLSVISDAFVKPLPNFKLPIAQPLTTVVDEGDDEIDAIDALDMDLFFIFEEECDELMPQLGTGLRDWALLPSNRNLRLEVLRVLHTLKGSARLAGALRLGEMTHNMESEIEFLGSDDAANQDFPSLFARFDAMQHTYENLRAMVQTPGFDPVAYAAATELRQSNGLDSIEAETGSATVNQPFQTITHPASTISTSEFLPDTEEQGTFVPLHPAAQQNLDGKSNPEFSESSDLSSADKVSANKSILVPAPQAMMTRPLRQAATATIRVRAQLLDRLVTQAGEVMITRSRLEAELNQLRSSLNDMSGNLDRLRQQLRDIELQAETQMQSRLAQAKEAQAGFDPLEFDRFTRVQELTRMMAESVNDVATVQRSLQRTLESTEDDLIAQARQTRELQRDLLRTRMVEFESISDRLYRVVRQASKDTGKQVKLDLLGGTIEMDRGMLDRLTPAFEHLLRNSVAHGVEEADVRLEAGKSAAGLITVHLRQAGNDVSVDFSDDGAGLNLVRIREKALSLGMITADQIISNQEAADLIFMPGFTTANQITELAGRGIGMDVVRSEIDALGGKIETTTEPGKGTLFKLVLPLTTAVTQVVMIRSGSLSIGVPASIVETVRRLSIKELDQAYLSGEIDVAEEKVPFFWSGALLQTSHRTGEIQAKTTPIVVFRSASKRVAMHVDDVLGNQEVVVKNLGPQLSRLPGLAGMSVLASGAVVLIYNPVALATVYGPQVKVWMAEKEAAAQTVLTKAAGLGSANTDDTASTAPLVLVVDDSITVRRVTQRFLQREGFRVVMAADGLQALEKLEGELPSVVLSDIEMPRMDGFDLARNIRADERLKNLPIIMITSRIAEKHREYAKELGVDHYLGKPYSEEILAALVRNYCGIAAVEAV